MTRGVGGESPANIQKFLHGVSYPAKKDQLLETARDNEAPKEVIDVIKRLEREEFGGPQEVMKAYGELD